MSIRSYDRLEAQRLIPLFESVAQEVAERRMALYQLDIRELDTLPESDQALRLQAERTTHRKELRLALREITRLGCAVVRDHPLRVLIPGPQGETDGFSWSTGQSTVDPLTTESAA